MTTLSQNAAAINELLRSPCESDWLKSALRAALDRDPVDAACDATTLNDLLNERAEAILADARRKVFGEA